MDVALSIVIVSWNVAPLLRECLSSIAASPAVTRLADRLALPSGALQVVVVDNASTDGTPAMVRSEFPWAQLIESGANLGFSAGNNLGMAHCRAPYILLLNPDTRLPSAGDRDPLISMLACLESHPRVGLLGPRLVYGDGSAQSSRRRFPTLMTGLMESTLLEQWFPRNRWARAYHMEDVPDDVTQPVDWVTGAAMLVRREVIAQVGDFDDRFFMYSEELDWCRRIRQAGWEILYCPEATVVHHEGQSSGQVVAARHIRFQTSKILYFRKHHGAAAACLLRVFIMATYLWQYGEETAKFALGHRRALRRGRIKAYAAVLRSGLRPGGGRPKVTT